MSNLIRYKFKDKVDEILWKSKALEKGDYAVVGNIAQAHASFSVQSTATSQSIRRFEETPDEKNPLFRATAATLTKRLFSGHKRRSVENVIDRGELLYKRARSSRGLGQESTDVTDTSFEFDKLLGTALIPDDGCCRLFSTHRDVPLWPAP